jgi:hypothetical protein
MKKIYKGKKLIRVGRETIKKMLLEDTVYSKKGYKVIQKQFPRAKLRVYQILYIEVKL